MIVFQSYRLVEQVGELICERGSGALNGSERVSSGRLTHTRTMLKGKTEDGGREGGRGVNSSPAVIK